MTVLRGQSYRDREQRCGCQGLGRGQEGGGSAGFRDNTSDPGGDGMFPMLMAQMDTQVCTRDKVT